MGKFDEHTARSVWIGWAGTVMSIGLAYLTGGVFLAYLCVFGGAVLALRGHFPGWFIDAQTGQHSIRTWTLAMVAALGLALIASAVHHNIAPEKPDLAKTIIDGIKKIIPAAAPSSIGVLPRSNQRQQLDPIVRDEIFSIVIPFNPAFSATQIDAIPSYEPNLRDDKGNAVRDEIAERFGRLALLASEWIAPDGKPSTAESNRPTGSEGPYRLLSEALQFYIIEQIDLLESDSSGISIVPGVGATPLSRKGDTPPNMIRYPGDDLVKAISANKLSRIEANQMMWKFRGYKVPKGTTVSLHNEARQDKPLILTFQLRDPSLYLLTFSVEPSVSSNLFPKGYRFYPGTDVQHVGSYLLTVNCHFEFKRNSNTDTVQQEEYTRWVEMLFAGLKEQLK